jgi:hypothetical protein
MADQLEVIVLAWYRRKDYARIYGLAPNGGGMEPTFDDWKRFMRGAMPAIEEHGKPIKKVIVEPRQFEAWLRAKNLTSTPETRVRFVGEIVQKRFAPHLPPPI